MGFKAVLIKAKEMDAGAIAEILTMYRPLIVKESIVMGVFDEDLHQELMSTLFNCILRIREF